jgi:putative selenate reductase FAD-binding subunit
MIMANKLLIAKTPAEALEFMDGSAVFLAGGTEVNRLGSGIADDAETLISLKKCEGLNTIKVDGDYVSIGSMCTFQQIIESEAVPEYLKEAARFMASRTKRNMATIGGNIAAWRSDSYLLPTLIMADANIIVQSKDGSVITMTPFAYAKWTSPDLITSIEVPKEAVIVSKRYSNTAQSHAVLTMSGGIWRDEFMAVAAVKNSGIYMLNGFTKALAANPDMSDDEIIAWFRDNNDWALGKEADLADDMFGSAAYKRYLVGVTAADMYRKTSGAGKEAGK